MGFMMLNPHFRHYLNLVTHFADEQYLQFSMFTLGVFNVANWKITIIRLGK